MDNPSEFSDAIVKKVYEAQGVAPDDVTAENVLHLALKLNNKSILMALIDAGANVNVVFGGETPLHVAVQKNLTEIASLLLENGANVNMSASILCYNNLYSDINNSQFSNLFGRTPLHMAASRNNIEIVKLLVNFKANVDIFDAGWAPLHLASYLGYMEVIKLLLDNNANVNARCNRKIRVYADNLFQLKSTIYYGRTSLHLAALNNRKDIVDILLAKGANINAADENSWTALHIACYFGYFEVTQLLLDRGANIEAEGWESWRPLHEACSQGRTEIVKLLVSRGANIEATKSWGDTPLHWAIWHNHLETVKALVELGADIFVCDIKGDSAIDKARMQGFPDILKYLLIQANIA